MYRSNSVSGISGTSVPESAFASPGTVLLCPTTSTVLPAGSTVLVVGHSNTVPGLAKALSGTDVPEMPETEFDRYTVIVVPVAGAARVLVSRY